MAEFRIIHDSPQHSPQYIEDFKDIEVAMASYIQHLHDLSTSFSVAYLFLVTFKAPPSKGNALPLILKGINH